MQVDARRSGGEPRRRLPLPRLHSRPRRCCTSPTSSTRRARRGLGRRVRRADDRSRQAPRLQEEGRRAADRRRSARSRSCGRSTTSRARPRSATRARSRSRVRVSGAGSADLRARDHRHRLASGDGAGLSHRQPARDGLDRRARSAGHPEVAARRRRRLHRARARQRLRRARHEGHGRRDDRRPAARRRSRSRQHPREAHRGDLRGGAAEHEGRRDQGTARTARGHVRRRRAAARCGEGAHVRSRARLDRPPAELRAVPGSTRRAVKVNTRGFIEVDGARRTAEPTIYAIGDVVGEPMLAHKASHEGARRRRRDRRASASRSSRWRSRRSSSPIPRSRGAG